MVTKKKLKVASLLVLLGLVSLVIVNLFLEDIFLKIGISALTLVLFSYQFRLIFRYITSVNSLIKSVNEGEWTVDKALEKEPHVSLLGAIHHKTNEVIKFIQHLDSSAFEFNYIEEKDPIRETLNELKQAQQKHLEEEARRRWKTEGLAKFGEIIRNNDEDLKVLSFEVLRHLVKYVNANQGGFFIEAEEADGTRFMELTACYAYDRKKFVEDKVYAGQGLTGQVMLEKDVIYITDVPTDYVNITSGLGEATPTNIIILPLLVNEGFYGAIEIASFNILQPYEIEFLREVSLIIASSISSVKTTQNTQKLLEESQILTQELGTKEEEMRQNMEELQATQEEMQRSQLELDGVFGALNDSQGLVEYDQDQQLISSNEWIQELTGFTNEELKINNTLLLPKEGEEFWDIITSGATVERDLNIQSKTRNEIWLNACYSPLLDDDGQLKKVLVLFQNTTLRKQKEKEYERLSLVADNTDNAVVITDKKGLIEYVNRGFEEITKYTLKEVLGKKPGPILQGKDTDKETILRISEKLKAGQPIYEEILNYDKNGDSYWISLAINPVRNEKGDIKRFIAIQANITETKKNALDFRYKLEAIDRSNAVIEFDLDGTILKVNENFLKIVGYKKEEVLGKHHSIFVHPDDKDTKEYQDFWIKLGRGEFVNHEFRRVSKDGEEIWLRGIYNPLLDMKGDPVKIIKFATDVTNEKLLNLQAEKQRKELGSHLETINKTIATIEFDKHKNIVAVNNIYTDVSGYTAEELKGQAYEYLLPKDEIDKPQTTMMWESIIGGNFFTGQFRQKTKNDEELWILGTFNPILDSEGNLESIKMFGQFNTHQIEKEMAMSQMLTAFQNTLPVVELSPEGICIKANKLFYNNFGTTRMGMRNKCLSDFLSDDFTEKELGKIISQVSEGKTVEEMISQPNKGDSKIYKAIFNPVFSNNELTKLLVVLIDKEIVLSMEQ